MKITIVLTFILIAAAACFGQVSSPEKMAAISLSWDDDIKCSAVESIWMTGTVAYQQFTGMPKRLSGFVLQDRKGLRYMINIGAPGVTPDVLAERLSLGRVVRINIERCGGDTLREFGPLRL